MHSPIISRASLKPVMYCDSSSIDSSASGSGLFCSRSPSSEVLSWLRATMDFSSGDMVRRDKKRYEKNIDLPLDNSKVNRQGYISTHAAMSRFPTHFQVLSSESNLIPAVNLYVGSVSSRSLIPYSCGPILQLLIFAR